MKTCCRRGSADLRQTLGVAGAFVFKVGSCVILALPVVWFLLVVFRPGNWLIKLALLGFGVCVQILAETGFVEFVRHIQRHKAGVESLPDDEYVI